MRPALDLLSQYAEYHRDRRNIVSHFVGVPMIVFAVGVLLARPGFVLGGVALTPAWVAFSLSAAWYLSRGDLDPLITAAIALGSLPGSAAGTWLSRRLNVRSIKGVLATALVLVSLRLIVAAMGM